MVGFLWLLPTEEWLLHKNKWKEEREIYEKRRKTMKEMDNVKLKSNKKRIGFYVYPLSGLLPTGLEGGLHTYPLWLGVVGLCLLFTGQESWFMVTSRWEIWF